MYDISAKATLVELFIFNVISTLPYMILVLQPFQDRLRYSKKMTFIGYLGFFLATYAALYIRGCGAPEFIHFIVYLVAGLIFCIFFVADTIGKSAMTFFIVFDALYMLMVVSKYIESVISPESVYNYYKMPYTLIFGMITLLFYAYDMRYSKVFYAKALRKGDGSGVWRYIWFVPFVFTINIFASLYILVDSTLEFCMHLESVISIIIVGIGAIIIFNLITRFIVEESDKRRAIENQYKYQDELNHDNLTKAGSRRLGMELLQRSIERRDNSVIMITDIDYFKHINDNYGHNIGDVALTEFVECLKGTLRSTDTIIRWGGDEFICIFEGLGKREVISVAEKVKESVGNIVVNSAGQEVRFTCSMGFTMIREDDSDIEEVLARADEALYETKENGRNGYSMRW